MERKENKYSLEAWLLPAICFVMSIVLFFYNEYIALVAILLTAFVAYKTYVLEKERKKRIRNYIDRLDIAFDNISKNAVFKMPFSVAVLDDDGNLMWYNSKFKSMTEMKSSLVDKKLIDVLPSIGSNGLDQEDERVFSLRDRKYKIYINKAKDDKEVDLTLLYLLDVTDHQDLIDLYEEEKLIVVNLQLDNYDELVQTVPNEKRPLLFAQIDRYISMYFHDYGAIVKKYENDKYFGIVESGQLQQMIEAKFTFIEKIRGINFGNTIPPTLSLGIGKNESSPRMTEKSANAALDIALGRGGDQVVIKDKEELNYIGGKNKATEKRTKVKARVIAHALGQLIDKSTEVFVMGHKNPDMDSFGSALGLMHAVSQKNKKVYLVLEEVTPAIKNLYERAANKIEGFESKRISPAEAYNFIRPSSLIIVTDNHRRNSTEEPRLFEKTENVFVIDHHRRSKDYIDNATLIYMEPYASSASELVTEMLMYMDGGLNIDKVVAEGLLAGITVDTKNFVMQTGVRTFEAASVLKRHGADSIVVKELFKDDLELIRTKADIISKAERILGDMAVGVYDQDSSSSSLIASQAADELLNAEGVKASFVLTRANGRTHISARSLGDVSVQLIMERLGGGGHLTASATQMDMTIEEAKEELIKAIEEYKEGEE